MKEHASNGKTYRLPSQLNEFQLEIYIHLIDWKRSNITTQCGTSGGHEYDAILPDSYAQSGCSPLVYPGVSGQLEAHRAVNDFRIHKFFYHMASSQAANVNLFLPILHHPNANAVFQKLKKDFASLATDELDHGYCIEFWGGNFGGNGTGVDGKGLLGDKSAMSGTDSDIAIAYYDHEGNLCLWLIEHKLTEAEFTQCGGAKSRGRQPKHNCSKCFADILADKATCYYHDVRKFNYWDLTEQNQGFFINHGSHETCPFKGGMNQLWRNQLLALAIEQSDALPYKHVTFSVVKHPRNTQLGDTIKTYKDLIADNPKFTTFTSSEVINAAIANADDKLLDWIDWYKGLYNI